ncbi:MAG: hypothetical protein QMD21_03425 [Candidatus Thermoplasmatota archaeon]|nr:hypothetical protein [Candidatus Thermoplasmatota archaeon]MDI6855820.1 hypothetical protein [Candidatus Thermoplasmatota archaeon]
MKKIKLIAIVVVAIVIIAIGATLVWYSILRGKKAELTGIVVYARLEANGLNLTIQALPPEYSGEAKFKISYDGAVTYPESALQLKTNLLIPYNEFVIENGNYTIDATFDNKTASKSFEIVGVVENIDVFIPAAPSGVFYDPAERKPKFKIQVWPSTIPFALTTVNVTIWKLELQNSDIISEELFANKSLRYYPARGIYEEDIAYTRSGYYKIYAELRNYVKPASQHLECRKYMLNETKGYANLINLKPVIIEAPVDTTIYNYTLRAMNDTVPGGHESDGYARFVHKDLAWGKSYEITYLAKDYDGITQDTYSVTWDFGWNKTTNNATSGRNDTGSGREVWYQYPEGTGTYTASLYIYDEYHVEKRECKITVVAGGRP